MIYSDIELIDEMAHERFSHPGHLINLDMNDYNSFAAGHDYFYAVTVKSEKQFDEFVDELRNELFNAQSAIPQPAEVLVHLLIHSETSITMANYSLLSSLINEMFGSRVRTKIGFAKDDSLPCNYKDIIVFIAGNN